MIGRLHSFQSLGTVDGPGVRSVAFLAGCPLRCGCCHNPDTWETTGGEEITAEALVRKIERFREYFGEKGGVTLSGGEPLLQAAFAKEVFTLCRERGINTCLDTSGCLFDKNVDALLSVTDRVLLDIKYTNAEDYRRYVGCEYESVLHFLDVLCEKNIPTTLRQVIIPTLNDSAENIGRLKTLADAHKNVDKLELLPFRKLCVQKYESMKREFPFGHLPEPSHEQMESLNALL